MPEHGDYNEDLRKWYCSYWITAEEWEDIHDYAPSHFLDIVTDKKTNNDNEESYTRESYTRTTGINRSTKN